MNPTLIEKVFLIITVNDIRKGCNIRAIEICADVLWNGAHYVLQYRTDESQLDIWRRTREFGYHWLNICTSGIV